MSLILSKTRQLMRARTLLRYTPLSRGAVLLDADWMPGPYPKNEDERKAAAKKYNLLREEYEPYDPKWDIGSGDYPCLPNRCQEDEDPYDNYEYMADSRHYGQPMNQAYEVMNAHGVTLNPEYERPFRQFVLITGMMLVFSYWYAEYLKHVPFIGDMKPLHMPKNAKDGVIHYHYPTSRLEFYEAHHHH